MALTLNVLGLFPYATIKDQVEGLAAFKRVIRRYRSTNFGNHSGRGFSSFPIVQSLREVRYIKFPNTHTNPQCGHHKVVGVLKLLVTAHRPREENTCIGAGQ